MIKQSEEMYSLPHLHMNVFSRDDEGRKQTPIDPYDIYDFSEKYPTHHKTGISIGESHMFHLDGNVPHFVDTLR